MRPWRAPLRSTVAAGLLLAVTTARAGETAPSEPLPPAPGDAMRGRAIVASRQQGLCLLCHRGPIPEERFQGTLAPDLAGVGTRWSRTQLRQRLVDPRSYNPDTIMPSYHRSAGLSQVGKAWEGRPLLTPQQIEDVVAYLATLTE